MAKPENKLKGSYQNILDLQMTAENVASGMSWYPEANKIAFTIGVLAGYSNSDAVKVGGGILSALSPTIEWGQNINIAILLVTEGIRKTYTTQHNKALAILHGADPVTALGRRARKTQAFYQAIIEPNNIWSETVIDRHAVAIYMGRAVSEKEIKNLESPRVYSRVAGAYRKAADIVGINHHVLQSQTWCQWRTNKGLVKQGRQLSIE